MIHLHFTNPENMGVVIARKRWSWIGHVLREESCSQMDTRGYEEKRPTQINLEENWGGRTSGSWP